MRRQDVRHTHASLEVGDLREFYQIISHPERGPAVRGRMPYVLPPHTDVLDELRLCRNNNTVDVASPEHSVTEESATSDAVSSDDSESEDHNDITPKFNTIVFY